MGLDHHVTNGSFPETILCLAWKILKSQALDFNCDVSSVFISVLEIVLHGQDSKAFLTEGIKTGDSFQACWRGLV